MADARNWRTTGSMAVVCRLGLRALVVTDERLSRDAACAFPPDLVIGIGGGSCLDRAKCVALLLAHGGKRQDCYGELKVPGPVPPLIPLWRSVIPI